MAKKKDKKEGDNIITNDIDISKSFTADKIAEAKAKFKLVNKIEKLEKDLLKAKRLVAKLEASLAEYSAKL